MTIARIIFFLHLAGFAAYLGAGFGQLQLMKRSRNATGAVRIELEKLAATVIVMFELPAIFLQLATGVAKLVLTPEWLKQPWMHAKLSFVLILLVLSHVEMFNAKAIVRLREDGAQEAEIEAKKTKHDRLGVGGAIVLIALMIAVTIGLR